MTAQVIIPLSEHLAESLQEAEREVMFAEDKYCGLRDGTRLWQQEYPEVFTHCPDPQQAAEEQAVSELDEARDRLAALTEQAATGRTSAAGNGGPR